MTEKREQAEVRMLDAQARAFDTEADYNALQSERLKRARHVEDVDQDRQRILDFVMDINDVSVYRAIAKLTKWRAESLDPITIRLNTPGGELFSAMALYDYIILLRQEGIEVNIIGFGMVASAGTVLMQAGTTRTLTPNTWFMIHEISAMTGGKMSEMLDDQRFYERNQKQFLGILSERSTLSGAQLKRKIIKKDWWLSSDEALSYGFVDRVSEAG